MRPWALFGMKKRWPKRRRKRATSHQKETVNSCYEGRMMMAPSAMSQVMQAEIKAG
jgi:hypothetical protein